MFKSVNPRVNFPKLERELLEHWYKSGIVKKYLEKNKNSTKKFSFLDGPITANNPMGVHHAWGRTYKDLWQRFWNMRGRRQRFQNGFDCQGLWVEVEVEKELGFKSKKDIEKYGIDRFVEKCKERVCKFAKIQTEQSKRLGYFMDWDNSYFTMSDENNYMIWHFLKTCHEKGSLYKSRDTVPWCPRCGTAISQHEILTEAYQEIAHQTVYFKLPILGRSREYLLVWTTTPWTVLANVAVAINPKLEYGKWKIESGDLVILSKKRALAIGIKGKLLKTFKGEELLGWQYQGPFDELPAVREALGDCIRPVVNGGELVTEEEGTGILHVAPGAGEEDAKLARELGLPTIAPIDEDAAYYPGFGEFSGQNTKEKPEIILDYLKKKEGGHFFYKEEKITHRYPVCWRCKTELVWRSVEEWYIAMDRPSAGKQKTLRQQMIEVAKKINWIPKWGLERELDWLRNMHDWLISKKRYWGLALPIWECRKCGYFKVIGGKEELKNEAVIGWEKFEGHSPHRPWIDEIKIKCPECRQLMSRIPDVGDPWLDAGSVPFSTLPPDWFPADFITESFPGQFKNWFYSLIAMSTVLKNTNPFRTVLGFATLLGEDSRPMHKSWGNAIEFNEGADKIGVDVMRWMYAKQNPENNLLFGSHVADQTRRKFHLLLWNVYSFFITYANLDNFQFACFEQVSCRKTTFNFQLSNNILDRWIISRLNETTGTVTNSLEKYDAQSAAVSIEDFVSDLSLWYVRRSRGRVGPRAENPKDKNNCHQTLYAVLTTLVKLLAPFTPFISEEIYTNLTGEESVHLTDWPIPNIKLIDEKLERQMALGRKVVEVGHSLRKEHKLKTRQPLALAWHSEPKEKLIDIDVLQQVLQELNIKAWIHENNFDKFVKTKGIVSKEIDGVTVDIDTKITLELREEGEAREIVRKIQEERKRLGFTPSQEAIVEITDWPANFEDHIKKRALVRKLIKGKEFKVYEESS